MVKKRLRLYQYQFGKREGLILQCGNGFGEIAPLPGWSRETLEEAKRETLQWLSDASYGNPTLPSVRFGIACAKAPLTAVKVPLAALHRPRDRCKTLKLKVGHLSVEQARDCVVPYVGSYRLRLDGNRRWTLAQALQFASFFSPEDFEYLEEPVDQWVDLIRFSKLTQFPIAVDESFREKPLEALLEIPSLKAVVIKPTLMGEIPPLPPHVSAVLSSAYETSLGILHIAHLANPNIAHGLDTFQEDLLNPPLRVEEGLLTWTPLLSLENPIQFDKLERLVSIH